MITALLARSPRDRLGTAGTHQVKVKNYFDYYISSKQEIYDFI